MQKSFLWPFPESEMRSRSKWKVCCTSTMIVQLICIKCVKICEAVWAESRTQSTTPIRYGRTDAPTHARTWILCPPFGALAPWGTFTPRGTKTCLLFIRSILASLQLSKTSLLITSSHACVNYAKKMQHTGIHWISWLKFKSSQICVASPKFVLLVGVDLILLYKVVLFSFSLSLYPYLKPNINKCKKISKNKKLQKQTQIYLKTYGLLDMFLLNSLWGPTSKPSGNLGSELDLAMSCLLLNPVMGKVFRVLAFLTMSPSDVFGEDWDRGPSSCMEIQLGLSNKIIKTNIFTLKNVLNIKLINGYKHVALCVFQVYWVHSSKIHIKCIVNNTLFVANQW